jgi:hypothetical protein
MKKIISIICFMLISFNSYAEFKLSKDEFLKKIDAKTITLQKTPIIAGLPPNAIQKLIEGQKTRYTSFKDEMFYVGYIETNEYRYFVFYEWYDRGCIFGSTQMSQYKNVPDEVAGGRAVAENKTYEKIDNKYCENMLGIQIPSSKGLFQLPERLQNIINNNKKTTETN